MTRKGDTMTEQTTVETYKRWAEVPDNLRTKTQLNREGLRLAPKQPCVAKIRTGYGLWELYDINQALPKRKPTEAQLASLAAARERARFLMSCGCGDYLTPEDYGAYKKRGSWLIGPDGQYRCRHCRNRDHAIEWAKSVLADEGAIILDTETTGLEEGAEIIEIAIINVKGETLFESLIKPHGPIGGTHIHGIRGEDVAGAPTWLEIDHQVVRLLRQASRIVVYNSEYDRRLIRQTQLKWGMRSIEPSVQEEDYQPLPWHCAMEAYAMWVNHWSDYHESYRWQRLEGGHRALGDCLACLEYIKRMANDDRSKL
jgi:DNA polymerase-3 subunit epsilon